MLSNNWIILGLIAAAFWGIYIAVLKIAVNPKYLNTPWPLAMLGLSLGIILVSAFIQLFSSKNTTEANILNSPGFWVSVAAGAIWSLGASAVLSALSNPQTDASRLVVIYNLNTVIAVLLTIFLLREIPSNERILEVILGTILVTIGIFLVSRA